MWQHQLPSWFSAKIREPAGMAFGTKQEDSKLPCPHNQASKLFARGTAKGQVTTFTTLLTAQHINLNHRSQTKSLLANASKCSSLNPTVLGAHGQTHTGRLRHPLGPQAISLAPLSLALACPGVCRAPARPLRWRPGGPGQPNGAGRVVLRWDLVPLHSACCLSTV